MSPSNTDVPLNSTTGRWILASTILASSMAFIDSTALNVVLPSLQEDLEARGTDIFWILNAYLLMLAALILVGGALGDKLGRKRVFMVGIVIFVIASVACGLSPTVAALIIARGVQGLGGALMIPGSLSIISATFHAKEKGRAIGTWSAATTLVTVGGPILGGALGDAGLWRAIFYINVPLGLATLFVLATRVPESTDGSIDHRLDYAGAAAVVLGLALLTFGFLEIPELGFTWPVYASLGAGTLALAAFVIIEQRSAHPMVPLGLFKNKTFTGANVLTFFLYGALAAALLFLTLNLVQVQGYSQLQAGLAFLPFTLLMATFARSAGGLVDRYGPRWLLIIGPAIVGVGFLLLARVGRTAGPAEFWTTFFPGIVVFAAGMTLTVVPLTTTVMGAVADRNAGTASGVNNALTRTASVVANAVVGALAIFLFAQALEQSTTTMAMPPATKQAVMAQAVNLGDAEVPSLVPTKYQTSIADAYRDAFVAAFRQILYLSAALAFLSAGAAFFLVDKRVREPA
ncbi:MAG: MFS transporter [Tunicatimonas sp.]